MEGVDPEVRNRIRIAVAAYAYELVADPIMSDAEFDELAGKIEVHRFTGNAVLDVFFWSHFEAHTGAWIHDHPELDRIARLYETYYRDDGSDLI